MNRGLLAWLAGLGTGAGMMYLFDPDRGHARRTRLRDRAVHAEHVVGAALNHRVKDALNRMRGEMAEAVRSVAEDSVPDELLVLRVRAKMGHAVTNPHPIQVTADGGRVTLEGPVPENEVERLLEVVDDVRGVRSVENRLQMVAPTAAATCCRADAAMRYLRWPLIAGAVGVTGAYFFARGRESEQRDDASLFADLEPVRPDNESAEEPAPAGRAA